MHMNNSATPKEFLNCLRIQIVPDYYEEQRIDAIVDFCKKYRFDNAMLFINAEEYNVGHMTKEEAKPWIETMKKAKKKLIDAGISVSLNPWMEIGHLDRGRKLKEGQDFDTQVDFNGQECEMVACPMDENWKEYFLDFYKYIIKEIEPDVVWVEDDFRLHNHGQLEYGGCFCEHHMKAFNEKLGTNYTREEFTDLLFRKNPDEKVKKAFLEVNRKCMADLAEEIGKAVHSLGLGTQIGLMSSMHTKHCMEYRDWEAVHDGFAQGGEKINRLHLPFYWEDISTKKYYYEFNKYSFVCRGYLPQGTKVLPELENGSFSKFAKDAASVRFELESSIPLEVVGMTYDIFDFVGNGPVNALGYGQEVNKIQDYMTAVMHSGYSYDNLKGITILLDEKNSYNRPIKDSFYDMMPDQYDFGSILQGHGISAKCSKAKEFDNEILVLAAGGVYNFSDVELEKLLTNNNVILDGKAVELIIDRGLGHLVNADGYKVYISDVDIQSYEQVEDGIIVNDIPGYRASAFSRTGNYVAISYNDEVLPKSRVYDNVGSELGLGITEVNGNLIIPYEVDQFWMDQLHPLRQKLVCDYINEQNNVVAMTEQPNIFIYFSQGEKNVVIMVNPTNDILETTRFKINNFEVSEITEIKRDGTCEKVDFTVNDEGFMEIDEIFLPLTTKTFIVE